MSLRKTSLRAFLIDDPVEKVSTVQTLWATHTHLTLRPNECLATMAGQAMPGRPALPRLVAAKQVPSRTPFTEAGLASLLHAVCHIEFNAINLALDAVWRFPDMPEPYYTDWLSVAHEESQHFQMLHSHLNSLGYCYGDFDAHDGLWQMCERTSLDVIARMALVPRTLEARGLDATPIIQAKLHKVATPAAKRAVEILDIILRDEVGHVAIGNQWYRWLCMQRGLDPVALYAQLVQQYDAPKHKPPFNHEARLRAGFTALELRYLADECAHSSGLP